jgi:uncharacterized protein YbjT (DUF2867 family)
MRIVIIGGSGLIGSQVVKKLGEHGHETVPASPQTGVNTLTGEGLEEVLTGADVLIDVSNSPSFADADVLNFFTVSTTNLLAAEKKAGVGHHVALSVVGSQKMVDSGYMRAKIAQEQLIAASGLDFSLVHATQFFEFVRAIADSATVDGRIRLAPVAFQPMASADVASAVGRVAVGKPLNGAREVGGPERLRMDEFIGTALDRPVVADPHAKYFGSELTEDMLVPGPDAELFPTTYAEWARK